MQQLRPICKSTTHFGSGSFTSREARGSSLFTLNRREREVTRVKARHLFVLLGWKVHGWLGNSFATFSAILVFCLLFAANGLDAADEQLKQLDSEDLTDAGDYYLLEDGKQVNLFRAKDEVAVRYEEAKTPDEAFQDIQNLQGVPTLEAVTHATVGQQRTDILQAAEQNKTLDVGSIKASLSVHYTYPVLVDPISKCRMIPTDELLVRIADDASLAEVQEDIVGAGLKVVERIGTHRMKVYLLRLVNPKASDPLETSRQLAANQKVLWAEPNFIREIRYGMTPNDPLFSKQQDKHNTGQNGGTSDADVDAPEAWDTTTGSSSVVIAIIDDGVDTAHTDLSIYNNPGESGSGKETNGVDDDGNGYTDDYQGWDFANSDNNPSPTGTNGHGTGCAGVAAARIGNGTRVAGIAGGCKILPVKILSDAGSFTTSQNIGSAISYAADFADVLSNSWSGGSSSSYINDGIDDAYNNGRGGKGCPVFFATGNVASIWMNGGSRARYSVGSGLGAGTYSFGFRYTKNSTGYNGEDLAKVDNVVLLDGDEYTHLSTALGTNGRQDFEGSFPPTGWSLYNSGGSANNWTSTTSGVFTGTGGTASAVSGSISDSQSTELLTPNVTLAGDEILAFAYYISSESNDDGLRVRVYKPFPWTHSGDANWEVVATEQNTGTYSAQAGDVNNSQASSLHVALSCIAGNITFYRRVSSEAGYDGLLFYIDGSVKGAWSGEQGWSQVSYSVSAGSHTFQWVYSKDISVSSGSDTAWIDDIDFPIDTPSTIDGFETGDFNGWSAYDGQYGLISGVKTVTTAISYPASHTNSIAVGASTDCDRRSDYSQYGTGLDFVMPSNGGWNDIATLDPTGSVGWTSTDYKMNFGGTSSACPLAAGIAALMLSRNSNLTASDIRSGMRKNCDKIGGVTYSGGQGGAGGWNQYYGYGRVNAAEAVAGAGGLFVELESFTAVGYNRGVKLGWKTASEISSAGFNILRSESANDGYVRINDGSIIPAEGNAFTGADYSYNDSEVVNGTTYYYTLEEIEFDGDINLYGPVSAAPGVVSILSPANIGSLSLGDPRFELAVDKSIKRMDLCISPSETLKGKGTIRVRVKRRARRSRKSATQGQISVVLGRRAQKRLARLVLKNGGPLYCGVLGKIQGQKKKSLLSRVNQFNVTN